MPKIIGVFLMSLVIGNALFAQSKVLEHFGYGDLPVYRDVTTACAAGKEVKHLNLSKRKLTRIPSPVFSLHALQVLDLSKNKLDSLPDSLFELQALEVLILSKNSFKFLPAQIGKLTALRVLIAGENEIEGIDEAIGNCSNLEYLDLWSNLLVGLPYTIEKLEKLKFVDLRMNGISAEIQDEYDKAYPNIKWEFSYDCNCND